jgi:uracil-DNA glycosylase family protein
MTTLSKLRTQALDCQACPLWQHATQTVFGAGPSTADVMLVGEQPGDQEDVQGKPFVGPAGHLLDRALEAAGIDRKRVYITNAVKHFKWIKQGKRRLHKKPSAREIAACNQWLRQEIDSLQPKLIVCLGATAATALLGASFKVTAQRGKLIFGEGERRLLATVHPASILRVRDRQSREAAFGEFVADIRVIKKVMG